MAYKMADRKNIFQDVQWAYYEVCALLGYTTRDIKAELKTLPYIQQLGVECPCLNMEELKVAVLRQK